MQDRLNKSDSNVSVSYNSNSKVFNITYKGQIVMVDNDGIVAADKIIGVDFGQKTKLTVTKGDTISIGEENLWY